MQTFSGDSMIEAPVSLDAERSILGAIFLDAAALEEARAAIHGHEFSLAAHRRIYASMCAVADAELAVDYITVAEDLRSKREIEAVGGVAYLTSLTEGLPRRVSIESYLTILREQWNLRTLVTLADRVTSQAGGAQPSGTIIGEIQTTLESVLEGSESHDEPLVGAYLVQVLNDVRASRSRSTTTGMSYGLASLDTFTGGMRHGEVTVIGARSGVGKSSLMIQAGRANCRAGVPVHLFSLEMTRAQVLHRLFALESGVPYMAIDRGVQLTDGDMMRVERAAGDIAEWPLRIHDSSDMHIDQIVGFARLSIHRYGTRFIAVDYAQNVQADGRDERTRVSDVSRKLTRMIKHQPAALMLLSQLRKVDREHYNKPPIVADLRETGQLENDAHIVLLLHRGWDEAAGKIAEEAEILIPKQRRGDTGSLAARFNRRNVTFEEL